MKIGCPKEIKPQEFRVGMTPDAVREAVMHGHEVLVESGAGIGSGFADADYTEAGARLIADAASLYGEAELIVKVKEPQPQERALLRRGRYNAGETDGATTLRYGRFSQTEGEEGLRLDGQPMELTPREAGVLAALLRRAGRIASKSVVLQDLALFGADFMGGHVEHDGAGRAMGWLHGFSMTAKATT